MPFPLRSTVSNAIYKPLRQSKKLKGNPMDIMTQIIIAADQANFDRLRMSLLSAYKALVDAPTLPNKLTYWEVRNNYEALSQIAPSGE
jgi:hypothetical protein